MYREWKEIELCWFGDVQRVEGNRIVLVWGCAESERGVQQIQLRTLQREWGSGGGSPLVRGSAQFANE
jgi:hypothetical protein